MSPYYGGHRQGCTFAEVKSLPHPTYEPLTEITRCLHISDVEESISRQMLVPQPIKNTRIVSLKSLKVYHSLFYY